MAIKGTTPGCFANHLGPWAIEPRWFAGALAAVRAGTMTPKAVESGAFDSEVKAIVQRVEGVGIVSLTGPMQKGVSKYGGASTVAVRQALRGLAEDDQIKSILLRIDSPGGHVAGTKELADDVASIDAEGKRIDAYVEDMGCSAAYWVASQCRTITANAMALVGSIGTILVLEDSSKAAQAEGVDVKVFSTGPAKGAGTPGTPITEDQSKYFQSLVEDLSVPFFAAVRSSRELTTAQMKAATTGECWLAGKAKEMGLVDSVKPYSDVVSLLSSGRAPTASRSRTKAALTIERLRG